MGETDNVHRNWHLTDREVDVLAMLAGGCTSEEAAAHLGISVHTVVRHVGNMLVRLGAPNRLWLVARAFSSGVLLAGAWPPMPSGLRCMRGCGHPDGCPARPVAEPRASADERGADERGADVCAVSAPR